MDRLGISLRKTRELKTRFFKTFLSHCGRNHDVTENNCWRCIPDDNQAIKANRIVSRSTYHSRAISRSSPVASRSSIGDRSPRIQVSRGHSAIVLHAWRTSSLYSWTMPAFYVRAHSGTSNRAVRSKKLPQHAIKTRIDTTCPAAAAAFAHRQKRHADCKSGSLARPLARSLDCDRIATRSDHKENKENVAWRGYESSSTSDYAFLAMSNDRSDLHAADSRARLHREGCHVSRLGQILIKPAPIASPARVYSAWSATSYFHAIFMP